MKFKKVEIQAFRAYNQLGSGTFDFGIRENEQADFISIYAPNGFGKTSFYDAVEYGITNNITRFIRKATVSKDWAKSDKQWSDRDRQYILRNRFADPALESFIRLTTTNQLEPLKRVIPKPAKNGSDYKFDSKLTESGYFQTVILSQEWISAFLKEDSGSSRYNTFMENFGDKEIDGYYKNIIALIQLNEKRIVEQKELLKGIQTTLNFNGDQDVLKRANEQVKLLQEKGEKLRTFDVTDSEKEDLNLINHISERISSLEAENVKLLDLSNAIELIYTGGEGKPGLDQYYNTVENLKKNKAEADTLQGNLRGFKDLKTITNQLLKVENDERKFSQKRTELLELIGEFGIFEEIVRNIRDQEVELKAIMLLNMSQQGKLLEIEGDKNKKSDEKKAVSKQISEKEDELRDIPNLEANFRVLSQSRENKTGIVNRLQASYDQEMKDHGELTKQIQELSVLLETVGVSTDEASSFPEYIHYFNEIEILKTQISEKSDKLESLSAQIELQEGFKKDLEQFIVEGSRLVNDRKDSSCPLCQHEYDSFEELQQKILNNDALSSAISALLRNYADEGNVYQNLRLEFDQLTDDLETLIRNAISMLEQDKQTVEQTMNQLAGVLDKEEGELNIIRSEWAAISAKIANYSIAAYQQEVESQLLELKKKLGEVSKAEGILAKQFGDSKSENERNLQKEKDLEELIAELKSRPLYERTIPYFATIAEGEEMGIDLLNHDLGINSGKLDSKKQEKENLLSQKTTLEQALTGHTEDDNELRLELVRGIITATEQVLLTYERLVEEVINVDPKKVTREELIGKIEARKQKVNAQIESIALLIQNFQLLSTLRENVQPFLKYHKAKESDAKIRERLAFLEDKVRVELDGEKNNVAKYIGAEIESFFYNELINDLYRRIDPHPDYKKIRFVCDFAEDKPKLDICVFDNRDELIIPTLYFSTAQLNILSLSIFLAKALNAKDANGKPLECIFIDDPIQSMDSINILSTIDLLRSIVVNQEKQIILSTHDENFHQLLRKKMPPDKFKSKFIELETFGKVKSEA